MMFSTITAILSSSYFLYATTLSSLISARIIVIRVRRSGPISDADTLMKYHNRFYSIMSLLLCIGLIRSLWGEFSQASNASIKSIVCYTSLSDDDLNLRYLFHASKFYEYIDIFNVLVVGGTVNTHFGFHHFTVRPASLKKPPSS